MDYKLRITNNKTLRYIMFFISIILSPLFVAITNFHLEIELKQMGTISTSMILSPFLAAFILEILLYFFLEILFRIYQKISVVTINICATIFGLGISLFGLFPPLLLVLANASLLASLIIRNDVIKSKYLLMKLGIIVLSGLFSFYGFALAISGIIANLVSNEKVI